MEKMSFPPVGMISINEEDDESLHQVFRFFEKIDPDERGVLMVGMMSSKCPRDLLINETTRDEAVTCFRMCIRIIEDRDPDDRDIGAFAIKEQIGCALNTLLYWKDPTH